MRVAGSKISIQIRRYNYISFWLIIEKLPEGGGGVAGRWVGGGRVVEGVTVACHAYSQKNNCLIASLQVSPPLPTHQKVFSTYLTKNLNRISVCVYRLPNVGTRSGPSNEFQANDWRASMKK